MRTVNVLSVSGGKDSTAMYLLALESGQSFRAIFADTGHELPETYNYVRDLSRKTGGPEIEWVRADFSERMETRRRNLRDRWSADGVPEQRITNALAVLRPTGNPFLDLCLLRGRFPSTRARFCSQELKHGPIQNEIYSAAKSAHVISWQGVRAEESAARRDLPQREERPEECCTIYRPIIDWSVGDVFAIHKRHGIEPNPLYKQGMGRVGCAPCIHASKRELSELFARYPDVVKRVQEWERLVNQASKRGAATFFANDKVPGIPADQGPAIEVVVEWAKTDRGGRQYGLLNDPQAGMCASLYGLCE